MSEATLYVVKGTMMAPNGLSIAFRPGNIIRTQEQWTDQGFKAEQMQEHIRSGFLIPCTLETVSDATTSRLMRAPQAIADMSKMDGKDQKEITDPNQDLPYDNDSTSVLGYDEKFLKAKNDQELREIIKQAIPGVTPAQLGKMSRAQMEDVLSSQKHTDTKHVPNETGGEVVPKT